MGIYFKSPLLSFNFYILYLSVQLSYSEKGFISIYPSAYIFLRGFS